jgi:DNA-binding MarR family transcriptional regulator
MPEIDPIIHQPVRLRIMASLVALDPGDKVDFTWLRERLNLTDGNLGAHLQKLEEAGYIEIDKRFVSRKPKTYASITTRGKAAFEEHIAALRTIIGEG